MGIIINNRLIFQSFDITMCTITIIYTFTLYRSIRWTEHIYYIMYMMHMPRLHIIYCIEFVLFCRPLLFFSETYSHHNMCVIENTVIYYVFQKNKNNFCLVACQIKLYLLMSHTKTNWPISVSVWFASEIHGCEFISSPLDQLQHLSVINVIQNTSLKWILIKLKNWPVIMIRKNIDWQLSYAHFCSLCHLIDIYMSKISIGLTDWTLSVLYNNRLNTDKHYLEMSL